MSTLDELQRRWYQPGAAPPWWTRPLAGAYGCATGVRRVAYRRGWLRTARVGVPVVVVGNLVAGGAGKTPLVIALVAALRGRGFRPGVVSRGYGGEARSPMLLDGDPDPALSGDEPTLIRLRTGAPVAIGADRVATARLLAGSGVDVIVADDGLQHYALAREVEICVVDGERRFGNGLLLPAGPLREPPSRLRRVDFVVCNGGIAGTGEVPMRLVLAPAKRLSGLGPDRPLSGFSGRRVHAVAGIGNPRRFFDALRTHGVDPVEHPFPDHRRYTPADFAFGDDAPVLMTEKDAVKCRAFAQAGWWSVPVAAELPGAFLDAVASRLRT